MKSEKEQEAPEQPWPPVRIWLPRGSAELAAVSPELQNVEGAWWVREADAAGTKRLTVWICCHCHTPRLPGEEPCKCGRRLHDSVQYGLLPPPQIPNKQVAEIQERARNDPTLQNGWLLNDGDTNEREG
jgi:hypothetical protein